MVIPHSEERAPVIMNNRVMSWMSWMSTMIFHIQFGVSENSRSLHDWW